MRGSRLARVDAVGGSTSQTGPSLTVDPTQYQYEQHYQEQAYQEQLGFQPGYQYQEGYEYHQGYHAQFHEGYQTEQSPQQQYVEPPQQQQHPQQHAEAGMEAEDGGFPGGPYELYLLPNFGKHVAYKLWNDKTVSIIALFNLMIFYYYVKFILRRICHVYLSIFDLFFTYLSIIDLFLT